MGDLDDVEKEIFRLKIAELTGRKIICFVDFCPNTLTIDYPDMSKFEEIKRGIDRLKAKTKVIFFLNSSEDIFNFPAAGVEMTYSSEVGEDSTQGAKFSWDKIKKFFFQK